MSPVKEIPLEVLFGNPERVQPQLSPDGKRMSYVAPVDGVLNVWVGAVGSDDFKPVTDDRDRGIRSYGWANDNRHLIYVQDQGGDENWRVYTVDLDTGDVRDRTPFDGVQARPSGSSKERPHEFLIGLNRDNAQLHDIYLLDLRTGELTLKAKNDGGFLGMFADKQLNVRGAIRVTPDGTNEVLVRDTEDAEWRVIAAFDADNADMSGPVGFSGDGKRLFMRSSNDANAARLVELDLRTGEQRVLAEDPAYDVVCVSVHPDTREPQVVAFLKERVERVFLDDTVKADYEAIATIDEGDISVTDRDHADATWMVAFSKDNGPTRYYSFDRATKSGTFLFESRPELNDYPLVTMEPFSFTARDGLEVHGYISFPADVERKELPAVLVVHGGPWSRDAWGYDPNAQWVANRGFVCVQVNYRGSIGYGKDFLNAGDKQWGLAMHDDLIDAVGFVVGQGWVDPQRIAIYGGSYGGYAALAGATFTPDVFRCAVSIVGPSNLHTLLQSLPEYWKPNIIRFHKRMGHPEDDKDLLTDRSPLSHVDKITIPVLVAQGANDPRVKQAESEQIVEAMKAKGIDHEYLLFPDEGHGFAKPENRMTFQEVADAFLKKHLLA